MKTKVIAYYLPQFHEVKENNEWWGKGFTEWTHVKSAKPLFKKHYQPRVPLNNNYYNLMNKEVVEHQTQLAVEYGIYGFAYYHYWFRGKKILEKPAENLLKWKEIKQNFFFFWANHSWYKAKDGEKQLLLEQTYGDKKDWIEHYEYMLNFFKDDRYIKINNCPVIGIFALDKIEVIDKMIECWNQLAIKDGYSGVYVIESLNSPESKLSSVKAKAGVIRQPAISMKKIRNKRPYIMGKIRGLRYKLNRLKVEIINYKKIANMEAKENAKDYEIDGKKVYYGISTGWDNTARHGNYGNVFKNWNMEDFQDTFKILYEKSIEEQKEFLFVNAWNEWAEGMHLEPDEKYGYSCLEAIRSVVKEK